MVHDVLDLVTADSASISSMSALVVFELTERRRSQLAAAHFDEWRELMHERVSRETSEGIPPFEL